MTRLVAIAAALIWPVIAVADTQTPARDSPTTVAVPAGTGSLSGVVIDSEKHPLRRVSVSLSGDMRLNRTTVTDDAGRFAFAGLPAGRFTLTTKKAGYPPMSYGAKRPFRTGSGVLLAEGQQVAGLTLQLARGAVLTGTVFDDRGQPMPGVPVMAWEVRTSLAGDRTFDMPATGGEAATTDDRGRFRVYGLPPGDYTVGTSWFFSMFGSDVRVPSAAEIRDAFQASTQPGVLTPPRATSPVTRETQRFNYAPVYHPNAVDPLGATTITLGQATNATASTFRCSSNPCRASRAWSSVRMGRSAPREWRCSGRAGFAP